MTRYGGEEFAILLPGLDEKLAFRLGERQDDSLSLLRNADRAMYIGAKKAGRNRVAVYEKYFCKI